MASTNNLLYKLGVNNTHTFYTLHAPKPYRKILPTATVLSDVRELPTNVAWIQVFYVNKDQLEDEIILIKESLSKSGQIWISWPKKSSATKSDLSDNVVRSLGLDAGLVDIKIASIDNTWSALKFVYRSQDR